MMLMERRSDGTSVISGENIEKYGMK